MTGGFRQWSVGRALRGMLVVGLSAGVVTAAPPTMRTILHPADQAYVGQFVQVQVDILSDEMITGSPYIDVPPVAGGVILTLGSQAVRTTEQVDGETRQLTRYELALFMHRAGRCELPPIRLRFDPKSGLDGPLLSPPAALEIVLPPGATPGTSLVSSPSFSAEESWEPEPGDARVGDAFVRTITMKADDVLGMGFPPLPVTEVEGLALYPEDPVVQDRENRGDFSGERIERMVYVCEREGTFELPRLAVTWFDLKSGSLKEIAWPARELVVAPNPALLTATEAPRTSSLPIAIRWAAVLLPVALIIWLGLRYGRRMVAAWGAMRRRRAQSEPARFRRVLKAERNRGSLETYRATMQWLDELEPGSGPARADAFLAEYGRPQTGEPLQELVGAVLEGCPDPRRYPVLIRELHYARSQFRASRRPGRRADRALPPLNPGA